MKVTQNLSKKHRRSILDSLELAHQIVDILEERKSEDILLLDLRPDQVIADFFIICTGDNERHLRALNDYVRQEIKDKTRLIPFSAEGTAENGWVVMDYGDVVVHLFARKQREYYALEELWNAASKIMLRIQ